MDLIDLKLLSLEIHILSRQLKRNLESLGFKYEDDKKVFVRAENGIRADTVVLGGLEGQIMSTKEDEEKRVVSKSDNPHHPVTKMGKSDLIIWEDGKDNSNTSSMSIGYQVEKQVDTSEKMKIKWELSEHRVSEMELKSRTGNNSQQINNVSAANLQYKTLKNQLLNPKTPSHVMKSATVSYTNWRDRVTSSCSKSEVFGCAHNVFDESPESKWVGKSVYANTYDVHFAGYAHKPPKPPDYTNHTSQKNSCIDNITKLTSHTPISRFTKTNVDTTYIELNRFQMIYGLVDITSDLQLDVGECAFESSFGLQKKKGNHFSMAISNDFKPIMFVDLRLFRSKMMMHRFLTKIYSIKHFIKVKLQKSGTSTKYGVIFLIRGTKGDIVHLIKDVDEFWLDEFCSVFENSRDISTRECLVRLWLSIQLAVKFQIKATTMLYNLFDVARTKFVHKLEGNYMKVVCESTKAREVDITNVFNCLVPMSSPYYEFLEPCMQALFELSSTTIKEDENTITFFSFVPDEEMEVQVFESRNSYSYSCLTRTSLWVLLLLKALLEKNDDHGREEGVVNLTMPIEALVLDAGLSLTPFYVRKLNETTKRSGNGGLHVFKIISHAVQSVLSEPLTREQLAWPTSYKLYGLEYELFFLCCVRQVHPVTSYPKTKSNSVVETWVWAVYTYKLGNHKIINRLLPTTQKEEFKVISIKILMVHIRM